MCDIGQVRSGSVKKLKLDLRDLGSGNNRRPIGDRRCVKRVQQRGHSARELQKHLLLGPGKLLLHLEAEMDHSKCYEPLEIETEDHRHDDREDDRDGDAVEAPLHHRSPLTVTVAVNMYPPLRTVLIRAGTLGSTRADAVAG